jgi:hypothetical protein
VTDAETTTDAARKAAVSTRLSSSNLRDLPLIRDEADSVDTPPIRASRREALVSSPFYIKCYKHQILQCSRVGVKE